MTIYRSSCSTNLGKIYRAARARSFFYIVKHIVLVYFLFITDRRENYIHAMHSPRRCHNSFFTWLINFTYTRFDSKFSANYADKTPGYPYTAHNTNTHTHTCTSARFRRELIDECNEINLMSQFNEINDSPSTMAN